MFPLLELPLPSPAYLDPSATSILLTTASGIVIAVSATLILWWRKAKHAVSKTLHIDENAHKEVEGDVALREDGDEDSDGGQGDGGPNGQTENDRQDRDGQRSQ